MGVEGNGMGDLSVVCLSSLSYSQGEPHEDAMSLMRDVFADTFCDVFDEGGLCPTPSVLALLPQMGCRLPVPFLPSTVLVAEDETM